ncbi:MAG: hypothetical protein ACI9FN_003919 [Saprospiraceae bacterium]|jgi:hypothetical protein
MFLQKYLFTFLVGLTLLTMNSCSPKETSAPEYGELIEIIHSSGDDYSYKEAGEFNFYAPYPFNQGSLKGKDGIRYDVVVLSKQLEKGSNVGIEIFAKMTIVDIDGDETDILMAKPTNKEYELLPIRDFYGFSVEQFYFKQMVQYWYSNRYGLNGTTVKGWEPASIELYKD